MTRPALALLTLLSAAPQARAAMDWQAAAVLDFSPGGSATDADAAAFASDFRAKLLEAGKYTVVKTSRDDASRPSFPCFSEDCAVSSGKRLNVKTIFIGRLEKKGARCALQLHQIDTTSGDKELSVTQAIKSCSRARFAREAATLAYAVSGKTPPAAETGADANAAAPDNSQNTDTLVGQTLSTQDPGIRKKLLDRAIATDKTSDRPFLLRGQLYLDTRRYREAAVDFTSALALNPQNTAALAGRGLAYARLSRLEDALTDLNKAVDGDKTSALALAARALVYAELSDFDKASADLKAGAEREPRGARLLGARGMIRMLQGQTAWAQEDLDQAIAEDDSNPRWLETRAQLNMDGKQYINAIADLNRAIRLDPENPALFRMRAKAYRERWDNYRARDDEDNAKELEKRQGRAK